MAKKITHKNSVSKPQSQSRALELKIRSHSNGRKVHKTLNRSASPSGSPKKKNYGSR